MYTVPIYINLLSLAKGESMMIFYQKNLKKPLDEFGVVKAWIGGKWAILISKPELLTEVFKNEAVYSKAGFRKRVPWGYFAYLFGDNIIDAHGAKWKVMMSIMKTGIRDREADLPSIQAKSTRFINLLLEEQARAGRVDIDPFLRRWSIAVNGQHFLDTDFRTLDEPDAPMEIQMREAVRVRPHTLLTTFPYLEKHPWAWISRYGKPGFAVADEFERVLMESVRQRARVDGSNSVVDSLERALRDGRITDFQFRSNIKLVFVASHENIQMFLNSAMWELGNNTEVQERLRTEVLTTRSAEPARLDQMPYLLSTIYEVLRLYPPLFQMTNRVTLTPVRLGNAFDVPAGTWIGWNAHEVQTNERVWPNGMRFFPERWGTEVKDIERNFRKGQSQGTFIAFNAHARKCLGSGHATLVLKVILSTLVRNVSWEVDPGYSFKAPPVSVPLCEMSVLTTF
ncbi:MAG: hypothetical protein L6R38_009096 [Xanthoria sp. 2 TBL-2021]|nr:MAG: hypothetical protein L6R38_009096 [Xanthoria sp. 2 TBL-2021]